MKKKKKPIYELLDRVYFVEGLEDIRFLHCLKRKYIKEFCEKRGDKICRIIFSLICEKNPKFILEELEKEEKSAKKLTNQKEI